MADLASLVGVYRSLQENTHNHTMSCAKLGMHGMLGGTAGSAGKDVAFVPEAYYPIEEKRGQVAAQCCISVSHVFSYRVYRLLVLCIL